MANAIITPAPEITFLISMDLQIAQLMP